MSLRSSIWDKTLKKNVFKTISMKNKTKEEVEEEIEKWKQGIRDKASSIIELEEEPVVPSITIKEAMKKAFRVGSGNSIVILASSGAGKTLLIDGILKEIEDQKKIIKIYMVGDIANPSYDDKKGAIMEGIHPNMIHSVRAINTALKKKYNFWFILDDIEQIKNRRSREDSIRGLMLSYRNQNLSGLLSIQSEDLISQELGSNANILFYGHLNSSKEVLKTIRTKLSSAKVFLNERNDDRKVLLYRALVKDKHFIVYCPLVDTETIYSIKIKI